MPSKTATNRQSNIYCKLIWERRDSFLSSQSPRNIDFSLQNDWLHFSCPLSMSLSSPMILPLLLCLPLASLPTAPTQIQYLTNQTKIVYHIIILLKTPWWASNHLKCPLVSSFHTVFTYTASFELTKIYEINLTNFNRWRDRGSENKWFLYIASKCKKCHSN